MHDDNFLRGMARGFLTLLKEQGFASYIYFMANFEVSKADMDRIHVFMEEIEPESKTIPAVVILFGAKIPENSERIAFYIVGINHHELWVNWQKLLLARRVAQESDPDYTEFEAEFREYNEQLKVTLREQGYNPVDFADIPSTVQ